MNKKKLVWSNDVIFDEINPIPLITQAVEEPKHAEDFQDLVGQRYIDPDDGKQYQTVRVAKRGAYIVAYRQEVRRSRLYGKESDYNPVHVKDVINMLQQANSASSGRRSAESRRIELGVDDTEPSGSRTTESRHLELGVDDEESSRSRKKSQEPSGSRATESRHIELGVDDIEPSGSRKRDRDKQIAKEELLRIAPHRQQRITEIDPVESRPTGLKPKQPKDIEQALKVPGKKARWKAAIEEELEGINYIKKVWTLELNLPPGVIPLKTRFVFAEKKPDDNGDIRFRARLVAKGFEQIFGIDFNETFNPTARPNTLRLFLYFVILLDMTDPTHIDAVKAFLNSDIDFDIWVTPPDDPNEVFFKKGEVYKLNKAIYGLKQSGRLWYQKVVDLLKSLGFTSVTTEPCLFFIIRNNKITIILIYVDDILIASQSTTEHLYFKNAIMSVYDFTDNGTVTSFLGVRITLTRNKDNSWHSIGIDQEDYIDEAAAEFKLDDERENINFKTPLPSTKLDPDDLVYPKAYPYRQQIGAALHVNRWTRPDIAFGVSTLARFNNAPTFESINALRHLWRYLSNTSSKVLIYELSLNQEINTRMFGYADSDWAGDRFSRKSTTGWMVFIGKCLINWMSQLQSLIAQSTAEAELIALNQMVNEVVYLQNFFKASRVLLIESNGTEVFGDNTASLSITRNPVLHKRTKHIEIPTLNIRQKQEEGRIDSLKVPTNENPADLLTKALDQRTTEYHCSQIGIIDRPHLAEEER